jgi:hypothetical protein
MGFSCAVPVPVWAGGLPAASMHCGPFWKALLQIVWRASR